MKPYKEWIAEVIAYAETMFPDIQRWYCFDNESWEGFWEVDYTPKEAFDEEMTYWDD